MSLPRVSIQADEQNSVYRGTAQDLVDINKLTYATLFDLYIIWGLCAQLVLIDRTCHCHRWLRIISPLHARARQANIIIVIHFC